MPSYGAAMGLYELDELRPRVGPDCYLAPDATLIGDVRLGRAASVWFQTVIRADNDSILIGDETNIQDRCVLHVDPGEPMTIGDGVTVGHGAVLHGCSISNQCLIGIGTTILNGARIGHLCLIGANSLITRGREIPERSLVIGSPGKIIREVTDQEVAVIERSAAGYVEQARRYRTGVAAIDRIP